MKGKNFLRICLFSFIILVSMSTLIGSSTYGQYFTPDYMYEFTATNPLYTMSNEEFYSNDFFSVSAGQDMSYSDIFGFNFSLGSSFYTDPFQSTGLDYSSFGVPGGFYTDEYDYLYTAWGGNEHREGGLVLPWTQYAYDINSAYGAYAAPFLEAYTGASVAYGMLTPFDWLGPEASGIMNLISYAPMAAQMDRVLGNQMMFTAQGMPFIATASYFNPYSNGSNWFFPAGVSSAFAGAAFTPTGGIGTVMGGNSVNTATTAM